MDDQREENSIALPKELCDEATSRAKAAGCGINDIIKRPLRAYFDLVGETQAGPPLVLAQYAKSCSTYRDVTSSKALIPANCSSRFAGLGSRFREWIGFWQRLTSMLEWRLKVNWLIHFALRIKDMKRK